MGLWPTSISAALAEPAFLHDATRLISRIGSKLPNPWSQAGTCIGQHDKEVEVVGHDDIAPYADGVFVPSSAREGEKRFVDIGIGQDGAAMARAECNEPERATILKRHDARRPARVGLGGVVHTVKMRPRACRP